MTDSILALAEKREPASRSASLSNYSAPVNGDPIAPAETTATMATSLFRRREAAQYMREKIGVGSIGLLAKLAVTGNGPRFRKFGARVVLYAKTDLDSWMAEKLGSGQISTSHQ